MSRYPSFSNAAHLRDCIKAAGWSCAELARQSGLERSSVFYWLRKRGKLIGYAPKQFRAALETAGIDCGPPDCQLARMAVQPDPLQSLDRMFAERLAKENARLAIKSICCGAMRSTGKPCPAKPVPGKARCKFHGGLSTGPRTAEGRKRLSDAMKARWKAGDFCMLLRTR